ncbi:MAG: SRPBCC family protein [Acidobacteria bacterium]|nr:SRPBCC family protein [Acidobacteriota bacterium]
MRSLTVTVRCRDIVGRQGAGVRQKDIDRAVCFHYDIGATESSGNSGSLGRQGFMKKVLMWTLGIFAGVVVAALIALFLLNYRADAGLIRATVEIRRTPDVVWPWLREPERLKSWVGWLVEVREVAPNMEGVGGRRVWVMEDRHNGNQKMAINSVVEEWDPPRRLAVSLDAPGGFGGRQTYSLSDPGGGVTRLEIEGRYVFAHWLGKLLEPVITASAKAKLEKDVVELKRLVETQTPIAAPSK